MKKGIALIVSIVIALSLCGCNLIDKMTKTKVPDLNVLFECDADIMSDKLEMKSHLKRFGNGYWVMEISEPPSLAGMTITYSEEEIDVKLGDIGFKMDKAKVNDTAIFKLIFDAFDNASVQQEMNVTESNDGLIMTGQNDFGVYNLIFDKETSILKYLEVPSAKLSMKISNFKLLTDLPDTNSIATETTINPDDINALQITELPAQQVIAENINQPECAETTALSKSETETTTDETDIITETTVTEDRCDFQMWGTEE